MRWWLPFVALAMGCASFDVPWAGDGAAFQHSVDVYTTGSNDFEPIPGARVQLASGTDWLVLVSAELSSSSQDMQTVEAEVTINGVPSARGGAQNTTAGRGASFQFFDVVSGGLVEVGARDLVGEGTVSDLQLIGLPLAATADVHRAVLGTDAVVDGGPGWTEVLRLDVAPSQPGEYLVLVGVTSTEAPSQSYVRFRVGVGGMWWADGPDPNYVSNGRATQVRAFLARVIQFDVGESLVLEGRGGNSGSTIRSARLAAFRVDSLRAFHHVLEDGNSTSFNNEEIAVQLSVNDAPGRYLVMQNVVIGSDDMTPTERRSRHTADGVDVEYAHASDSGQTHTSYGAFRLINSDGTFDVESAYGSDGASPVRIREAAIQVLGAPD